MNFKSVRQAVSLCGFVVAMAAAAGAHAQATRTWVSGVGDDANPCSRTAPCKTFAGAISKTAAGGILSVLDPGGFGAVTIVKAITIDGGETTASILSTSTNGVIVNAATTDLVVLRNLQLDGTNSSTGTAGVAILQAGMVVVENVTIQRYSTGVDARSGAANVKVDVRNAGITGNVTGVHTSAAGQLMTISNSAIRGNGTAVVTEAGEVSLRNNAIVHNTLGLSKVGGVISSFGDNNLEGNTNDGLKPAKIGKRELL